MSSHTKNVLANPRASLCVVEKGFEGAADARATFVGSVIQLQGVQAESAREAYLNAHPGAFWVTFGDFNMYRLEEIKEISFVGGFARAGTISHGDYKAARVDPLADFAGPVISHMNQDHSDSLKEYLRYIVGVDAEIDSAKMRRLDRYGFDVSVYQKGGGSGNLRVPFDEPVTERKAVKNAIVKLSQICAERKAAGGGGGGGGDAK